MQDRTVRLIMRGQLPKSLILPSFDMTAQDVFAEGSGGGKVSDGHTLAVNGNNVAGTTIVRPGDTIAEQPLVGNG